MDYSGKRALVRRRTAGRLPALALAGVLAVAGCTAGDPEQPAATEEAPAVLLSDLAAGQREVLAGSRSETSVAMSRALFERSPVAVVFARHDDEGYARTDAGLGPAASAAAGLHVPLLVLGPEGAGLAEVTAELDRLGVETVVGYGDPAADWPVLRGEREMLAGPTTVADFSSALRLPATAVEVEPHAIAASVGALESEALQVLGVTQPESPAAPSSGPPGDLTGPATTDVLPEFRAPEQPSPALVLATATSAPASLATARAAGAEVQVLPDGDPRSTPTAVQAVHAHAQAPVLAVGDGFGPAGQFAARVDVAATGVELPGGGQTVFPGRRMVALYGHPSGPSLGALGEQGIEATMARARELAAQYQPFSDEPVVPALDLIASVASSDPGPDGDYSNETPIDVLEPWIEAADEAGVYVILDFQSGRTDFLSQVRRYEDLLARPSVGLALDPEWRLAPDQVPLEQIGTVGAAEINATSTWLADLTRDRALPQKLFMVHQFRVDMISGREDLDVSRSELSMTLHADGHGTPGEKLETWGALQGVMPRGIWPSWKNFYDEDKPMLTPAQTYSLIEPKPWLVTYQ
ncbi:serine/threonine-protein kinase [Arthrobacter sp. MDT1-65]